MLPVLWLLGTSGVGKSTVGYRMLSELERRGVVAAFVDADQLRLAAGIRASETDLIAAALPAMSRGYQAHGARVLIVAGLAADDDHLARLLPGVSRDRVLAVHLDADDATIRERVHRRGWLVDLADDAVRHAAQIDPDAADMRIDTTGQDPADLASQIADATLTHLATTAADTPDAATADDPISPPRRVIAVTGPGGVGVSTTGYQVFAQLARAGEPVGYLDTHQLGFLSPGAGDHTLAPLRAENTRTVADRLAARGARTIVVTGDARTMRILADVWDKETLTVFWLDASARALAERITARARGGGPPIQGDHRLGLAGPALTDAIDAAVHESEDHSLRPPHAQPIDTTDLDPARTAETITSSLPDTPRHPVVR